MLRRSHRPLVAVGAVVAVALSGALAPASPVHAATGVSQTGVVRNVYDGDTLTVDLAGDGTATPVSIRLAGIQAMEMTKYSSDPALQRGECHAVEATRRLTALVLHKTVKVTAQHASSMSGSRYRRAVWLYVDGGWRDVAQILLREGHGLFLANGVEYATNKGAAVAAQLAASRRVGMWDTDWCGTGPYQSARLRIAVQWDAAGNDATNVNGEWFRIANDSAYAVPLGGWRVRDSAYRGTLARGYVLPSSAKVPARGYLIVHVGKGTNTGTRLYWGQSAPVFENSTSSPKYIGDGGYLFDPQGDLRAWQQYPCRYAC